VIGKDCRIHRECACAGTEVSDQDFDAESLAHVHICAARSAYQSEQGGKEVLSHLSAALAIIKRLRAKGKLDIWHFLLSSPTYTKTTIHTAKRYASAAKDANRFVFYGLEDTLTSLLRGSPHESRVVTVQELEDMFMVCMLWNCQNWARTRVWKNCEEAPGGLEQRCSVE
jgi:hypothetical protein